MRNNKRDVVRALQSDAVGATVDTAPSAEALVAEIFRQQLQIAVETSIRSVDLRTRLAHRKVGGDADRKARISTCIADSLDRAAQLCAEQWLGLLPAAELATIAQRLREAPAVVPALALVAPAPVVKAVSHSIAVEPKVVPVKIEVKTESVAAVEMSAPAIAAAPIAAELASSGTALTFDQVASEAKATAADEVLAIADLVAAETPVAKVETTPAEAAKDADIKLPEVTATSALTADQAVAPAKVAISPALIAAVITGKPDALKAVAPTTSSIEPKAGDAKTKPASLGGAKTVATKPAAPVANSGAVAAGSAKKQAKPARRLFGFLRQSA